MAKIKQYKPAFFSGFDKETKEFNSLEELFAIQWVDSFANSSFKNMPPLFYRFSVSQRPDQIVLMAEFDEGNSWWVVGYIELNNENDQSIINKLPKWKPNEKSIRAEDQL
jgi:hypothetical protein